MSLERLIKDIYTSFSICVIFRKVAVRAFLTLHDPFRNIHYELFFLF